MTQSLSSLDFDESHRRALVAAAKMLRADDSILAVMLHGSLVRGTARPDSDVDLIAVLSEPTDTQSVSEVEGLKVEVIGRLTNDYPQFGHSRDRDTEKAACRIA